MTNPTPKFEAADDFRKQAEGGYSYNPAADRGGETIFGISRVANPEWEGWATVDQYTGGKPIPTNGGRAVDQTWQLVLDKMNSETTLQQEAEQYFFDNYWTPIEGDALPDEVDMIIYDMSVNSGPGRAIKLLQQAVKTSINGHLCAGDIAAAGQMYIHDSENFLDDLFTLRLGFYKSLVAVSPTDAADLPGWINRLKALANFIQMDPLPPCLL